MLPTPRILHFLTPQVLFLLPTRHPTAVFRTVQSVFFRVYGRLWKIRLGPDALRGPVGPCGIFLFLETSS